MVRGSGCGGRLGQGGHAVDLPDAPKDDSADAREVDIGVCDRESCYDFPLAVRRRLERDALVEARQVAGERVLASADFEAFLSHQVYAERTASQAHIHVMSISTVSSLANDLGVSKKFQPRLLARQFLAAFGVREQRQLVAAREVDAEAAVLEFVQARTQVRRERFHGSARGLERGARNQRQVGAAASAAGQWSAQRGEQRERAAAKVVRGVVVHGVGWGGAAWGGGSCPDGRETLTHAAPHALRAAHRRTISSATFPVGPRPSWTSRSPRRTGADLEFTLVAGRRRA
jgi:hypothetical protein